MRARPKLSPSALSLGPGAVLTPLLLPAVALPAAEQFRFDTSFQTYDESAGRMYVESYYYRGEMFLSEDTSFRFQLLRDAISGSTPIGVLPGNGTHEFLVEIDDVRTGVLAALSQQIGEHRVELEVSNSQESDYLSQGIALSDKWELNQKNTTLNFGLNFLNDTIVVRGTDDQNKKSYDAFLGFSQLLDKNTILSANLTVGYAQGYLNDQYKRIQRDELFTPQGGGQPFPVVGSYAENRPSSRLRGILQFQGTHYFRKTDSALDAVLRFGEDDYGISSQTLQVEWRQGLFKKRVEITPFFRYYQQTAADFFHNTLNEVNIGTPEVYPHGDGPNYSADYRLSSMATMSVGLKTRLRLTKNLNASLTYEHYDMSGIGSDQAPAQAYPTASMWTLGLNFLF